MIGKSTNEEKLYFLNVNKVYADGGYGTIRVPAFSNVLFTYDEALDKANLLRRMDVQNEIDTIDIVK